MKIETLDDVLNEIADRFMIYGACKSDNPNGCFENTNFCCRVGFMSHYEDRVRESRTRKNLKMLGFNPQHHRRFNLKMNDMHLVNFPKVRVKEYPKGFVVEIQLKKWWGKKYWTHIESVSGMIDEPWYYSDMDKAVEEAKKHFGWDLYHGAAFHQ